MCDSIGFPDDRFSIERFDKSKTSIVKEVLVEVVTDENERPNFQKKNLNYGNLELEDLVYRDDKGRLHLQKASIAARNIELKTNLNKLEYYLLDDLFVFFCWDKLIYLKLGSASMPSYIVKLFVHLNESLLFDMAWLKQITENLKLYSVVKTKTPYFPSHLHYFLNGAYNFETGEKLDLSGKPRISLLHNFTIDATVKTPHFDAFLDFLADGNERRKEVFLAILYNCFVPSPLVQKIFYLWGIGGSGKSTFTLLAEVLTGSEYFVSTSLTLLNKSLFETANLQDKRLIVLADQERDSRGMNNLKVITGGDSTPARKKNRQEPYNGSTIATVIITSNKPFRQADTSEALLRRICPIGFQRKPPNPMLLISKVNDDQFVGPFTDELSGIAYKVMSLGKDKTVAILNNSTGHDPSLQEEFNDVKDASNPFLLWFKEYVVKGGSAPVGYTVSESESHKLNAQQMGHLYPAYN